jgi:hypothetical protein
MNLFPEVSTVAEVSSIVVPRVGQPNALVNTRRNVSENTCIIMISSAGNISTYKSQIAPPCSLGYALSQNASQYRCRLPLELPMACEYSHKITGRSSSRRDDANHLVVLTLGYMQHTMSVSSVQPVPSGNDPPPSYTTGRDASKALIRCRALFKFRPRPDSLPMDQKMTQA